MNTNNKTLILALVIFAIALLLRFIGILSEQIANYIIIAALCLVVIALYKLVFKKLRK